MKQNVKTISGSKEITNQPKKKTKVEEYVVDPDKVLKFTRGARVKTKVSMRSYTVLLSQTQFSSDQTTYVTNFISKYMFCFF